MILIKKTQKVTEEKLPTPLNHPKRVNFILLVSQSPEIRKSKQDKELEDLNHAVDYLMQKMDIFERENREIKSKMKEIVNFLLKSQMKTQI